MVTYATSHVSARTIRPRHSFLQDSCSFKRQEGCLQLECLKFESLSFREVLIGSGLASRITVSELTALGEVVAIKFAP